MSSVQQPKVVGRFVDPYVNCGLRRNPFIAQSVEQMVDSDFIDRGHPACPEPGTLKAVQVIGDKGAGKSTTLAHWRRSNPGPYVYVAPGFRRIIARPKLGKLVYWDEIDRYPKLLLFLVLAFYRLRRTTLVFGTHQDLAPWLRLFGYEVSSFTPPPITTDEVLKYAELKISAVRTGRGIQLSRREAEHLRQRSHSCWRQLGDDLHCWAANKVAYESSSANQVN